MSEPKATELCTLAWLAACYVNFVKKEKKKILELDNQWRIILLLVQVMYNEGLKHYKPKNPFVTFVHTDG